MSQAAGQSAGPALDTPVRDISEDLLEMNRQAKTLAEYLRESGGNQPFTVGIFAEWGEGKTTFVNFVQRHLEKLDPSLRFITFSAWPYTTSDRLWRALVLSIARAIYLPVTPTSPATGAVTAPAAPTPTGGGPPQTSTAPTGTTGGSSQQGTAPGSTGRGSSGQGKSDGFLPQLARFFARPAVVLSRPPQATAEQAKYDKIVEELAGSDFGAISKRTPLPQIDEDAVMSAVVGGAVAALSTVSPLVAGLAGFLNYRPKADAEKLLKKDSVQSAKAPAESLDKFRETFGKILKEAGARVYVFLDDLDRCQPDVALDIMESIRITLAGMRDADCVFILAVDERLIAEGLRLRYRELFANEQAPGAFATKGQEYLEKIIQLRMRVPPRTAQQTQRFVAAQFPEWAVAGDIVESVVGNNPRRLKQYCQRLSFQRRVGDSNFGIDAGNSDALAGPCVSSEPSVTMTPGAQDGEPGASLSYTVSVTNKDSADCVPARFNLEASVPAGWASSIDPPMLLLAPGASGSATITATSTSGSLEGSYTVGVTVADSGRTATATAAYLVRGMQTPSKPVPVATRSEAAGEAERP